MQWAAVSTIERSLSPSVTAVPEQTYHPSDISNRMRPADLVTWPPHHWPNVTVPSSALPPSVGGVVANAALPLCGRIPVNLNYTVSSEVMNNCIAQCGIKHVLTSRQVMKKLEPGMSIFLGTGVCEPRTLVKHLMSADSAHLKDLELI